MKTLITTLSIIGVLLLSGELYAAGSTPQKQTATQLKSKMVAVKRVAWDRRGNPTPQYAKAVGMHAKVNGALLALANNVIRYVDSGKAKLSTRVKLTLKKAGASLRKQSQDFQRVFGRGGIEVPPRIENPLLNNSLSALTSLEKSLPQ